LADLKDNGYEEVAQQIEPYTDFEVEAETGIVVYKYRLPAELRAELLYRAKLEHITLRELLTRAANLYLALDISGQKPGTYYTRHTPGETPERIIFPFWPFRKRMEK
jgi:hypothetical protein